MVGKSTRPGSSQLQVLLNVGAKTRIALPSAKHSRDILKRISALINLTLQVCLRKVMESGAGGLKFFSSLSILVF